MKNLLHSLSASSKSSARVVDGKLILSFPHAKKPVVWQMDLTDAKASALEVEEHGDGFALFVKTPKGEGIEIAPFETKEDAVDGLMAASHALENAHGAINPNTGPAVTHPSAATPGSMALPHQKKNWSKWMIAGGALLLFFFLMSTLSSMQPKPLNTQQNTSDARNSTDPRASSGVPVSADDFLNNQ